MFLTLAFDIMSVLVDLCRLLFFWLLHSKELLKNHHGTVIINLLCCFVFLSKVPQKLSEIFMMNIKQCKFVCLPES